MSHTLRIWISLVDSVPDIEIKGDISFISDASDTFHQINANDKLIIVPLSATIIIEETK